MEKLIPNILYVPGLAINIFSVKQLDEAGGGIRVKFGVITLLNASRQIIAECKLNLVLFELGTTIIPNSTVRTMPTTTNLSKVDLWHLRLGHINPHRL